MGGVEGVLLASLPEAILIQTLIHPLLHPLLHTLIGARGIPRDMCWIECIDWFRCHSPRLKTMTLT